MKSGSWPSAVWARLHLVLLLGLPVVAFGGYFGQTLSVDGDNLLHLYRLVALQKNIAEGNFYPRWTAELFLGFGYPLLNFYASATYYAAELLHLLGAGYADALIYTFFGLLVLAAVGVYRLAFDLFAEMGVDARIPARVAAAAYVFAPYLLFNLYVRGAIAEVGAQALLPWLLWSFRRLLTGREPIRDLLWSILCLAGLALTHSVSLLLAPPILVVYAGVLLWGMRSEWREGARRLGWFVAATAGAAAVSAFFWLPALLERQFLTTQAQDAAAQLLDQHMWTWQSWLDTDWTVAYNDGFGTALRRGQLLLALLGVVLARQRTREWIFWVGLAVAACLLAGAWAAPFWRSHPLLLTVQFPWRMVGIASLPLALLTGGIATRPFLVRGARGIAVWVLLTGVIVFVHYPRLSWLPRLEAGPDQVNLTSISQYEAVTGRYGLSAATFREFTPRWVEDLALASVPPISDAPPLDVVLTAATAHHLELAVAAPTASRLLFSTLYFPGWQVRTVNGEQLIPYPVSNFGLLAVYLPAGEQQVTLRWGETPARRWGQGIAVAALLGLAGFYLSRRGLRAYALVPLACLGIAGGLMVAGRWLAPPYIPTPDQPVTAGVQLLGYTIYREEAEAIYLFPHWYVAETPTDLMFHWQLLETAGNPVTKLQSFPYFNTLRAFQWSPNMIVDDGVYLPLPPGLAAGSYTLAFAVTPAGESAPPLQPAGTVEIAHDVPPLPTLAHPHPVRFQQPASGSTVTLQGYEIEGAATSPAAGAEVVVAPGDTMTYTLFWQADPSVPVGTQVFAQLLDHRQQTLTQVDQELALGSGAPYYLWHPFWLRPNAYRFEIPADAPSGLYRPYVGLYNVESNEQWAAHDAGGAELGDAVFLPPLKVARRDAPPPANALTAQFGEGIRLEGYGVELPEEGLRAGSTFTLTLHYQSHAPVPLDYTQFVHFHHPDRGMAAQVDAPPHAGGNPTSTWVPGEVIVEVLPLHVAEAAAPGRYQLALGLYNPADGVRLPVVGPDNQTQPDNRLILGGFTVEE